MRLTLLAKMLLFSVPPTLLGFGLMTAISFKGAENALTSQIREELTLTIDIQTRELGNTLSQAKNIVQNYAEIPDVLHLLQAYENGAPIETQEALRATAQDSLDRMSSRFSLIQAGGLLASDGTVLLHSEHRSIGTSRADRSYFKTTMQGKTSTENLVSASTGELTTIISIPVFLDGKVAGVLFANLALKEMSKTSTDSIKIGKSGECFVIDGNGIMIAHPDKSNIGESFSNQDWIQRILSDKKGRVEYTWNGTRKIAYFRDIQEVDWYLVLATDQDELLAPTMELLRNSILLALFFAFITFLVLTFVARSMTKVLNGCVLYVGHVAKGNLSIPAEMQTNLDKASERGDEIGTLSRGIGQMVDGIRKLFSEAEQKTKEAEASAEKARVAVKEAEEARKEAENARRDGMLAAASHVEGVVNIISSASTELSAQIEQSGRGAEEQAARTAETATAMEEMNSTVIEVAKNAGEAAKMSSKAREKAEEGEKIVRTAVESIKEVQCLALDLMKDMKTLDNHAQSISQIMNVISDIADQTNLLALNAATEAARAGEAGRGFAVVADEVRKLAEKTMASTSQVGEAIKAIQESADISLKQVETAVRSIDSATELAGQSGNALEEIVKMTENAEDQVRAIAAASEQQSASSEEINKSVTQVTTIAGETARAMEEAAKAVSELAAQAQILNGLVDDMRRA